MGKIVMDERIKKLGVILTSHPRQQLFMRQGIMSWLGWKGGPIVLVYDDIDDKALPKEEFCPPITNIICTGQRLGHKKGELYGIKIGAEKLRDLGCEYIFKTAADTTIYRHRGFNKLFQLYDEYKVDLINAKRTVIFFGRTEAVCKITETIKLPEFIPLHMPEPAEGWFGHRLDISGIKEKRIDGGPWWEKELGRIHVQGEYALDYLNSVVGTWKIGEIWPRIDYVDILERGNKRLVKSDMELLERTVRETKAKTIVEIGSMDGTSSLLFGSIAKEIGAKVYCIEPDPRKLWYKNIEEYGIKNYVTMIKAASPWVNMGLIPRPIDYLFIDGNHRTRYCLADYHFFEPFVRKGGMIAFHDYNGRKGVSKWIRKAIEIILEDDSEKIVEVEHNDTSDRGTIVFRKIV